MVRQPPPGFKPTEPVAHAANRPLTITLQPCETGADGRLVAASAPDTAYARVMDGGGPDLRGELKRR
jgi:hypothetical protein